MQIAITRLILSCPFIKSRASLVGCVLRGVVSSYNRLSLLIKFKIVYGAIASLQWQLSVNVYVTKMQNLSKALILNNVLDYMKLY